MLRSDLDPVPALTSARGTGVGFAVAVQPVAAQTIVTDKAGLVAGEVTIRAGDFDLPVTTVALCGGAGDAYLSEPAVLAADVYITSDLRHHPASEARENARASGRGPALIDVSHWASEWLWLDSAAAELREALPGVTITVSDLRTDPWDFAVTQ